MKITLTPVAGSTPAHIRYEGGKLTHNGQAAMLADHITIEYGEESGVTTFSDDRSVVFEVIPSTWINPNPPAPVVVEDDGKAALLAWRETAGADRWQVILALGPVLWGAVQEWRNDPDTPWQVRMIIDNAQWIPRISDTVELLAWVLQLDQYQADDVIRRAQGIQA